MEFEVTNGKEKKSPLRRTLSALCTVYCLFGVIYAFHSTLIPAAVIGSAKVQVLAKQAKVKIGEFYENLNSSLNQ